MSAITVGGDLVHYEVLGRGRAVILLDGWLGSWRSWVPTMQQLSTKYRVYALDLFGFGDSAKNPAKYPIGEQVKLIDEFMKQLGIPKAAVIGHGLGAMVLAEYALHNQDKVARMLLSGAPLFDPGDLDERTPAGQRKLLTADPNALNKLSTAESKPAVTSPPAPTPPAQDTGQDSGLKPTAEDTAPPPAPPVGHADVTIPTRPPLDAPPTAQPAPAGSQPAPSQTDSDAAHSQPTVPRVSADARARLEEAARAAGAAVAGDAPKPNDGVASAVVPASAPAPSAPSTPATTQAAVAGAPTIANQPVPAPAETKLGAASPFEQLAHMTFSNKNPLLEAFASASMDGLLGKCFKPSDAAYDKLKVDIDKCDHAVLKHSVMHFDSGRMLDTLRLLTMPVVVVHGSDDPVIPRPSDDVWHYLTVDKEDTLLPFLLQGVRHFPMLEHEPFQRLALQFLDLPEVHKLEVVPKWVRRTR